MIEISFYPDSDCPEYINAVNEYQGIWKKDGQLIIERIEQCSKLKFAERIINSVVYEGISRSYPLLLRASYQTEIKTGTLIHELCHRLLTGNVVRPNSNTKSFLDSHKPIDLLLYDIWLDIYGKKFADHNVAVESQRDCLYKEAWDWTLAMSKNKRQEMFSKMWLATKRGRSTELL